MLPSKESFTTCQFPTCGKTLGQDSRDSGFPFCKDHRICTACTEPMSARECLSIIKELAEDDKVCSPEYLLHPRCSAITRRNGEQNPSQLISQSYLDFLNTCRLMIEPDLNVSVETNENTAYLMNARLLETMDFDRKCIHLKMMEACVAHASIAVRSDPKGRRIKDQLEQLNKRARADQEKLTSSRPTSKEPTDAAEVVLAEFMRMNDIKERKVGQKLMRDIEKGIMGLIEGAHLDRKTATGIIEKGMRDKGLIK